jgi:hypothetical protein
MQHCLTLRSVHLVLLRSSGIRSVCKTDEDQDDQFHGAGSFLRSQKLISHSRNPQNFMELESSLPC